MGREARRRAAIKRQCGDCQLCCTLLPVVALQKDGGVACRFQEVHKGCTVYRGPEMPEECGAWSCRWLINDDAADLRRPDESHYVIDVMPDYITVNDRAGEARNIEVVQIWVDPQYPDAHHDPALRRWLYERAKRGIAALVRYSPSQALVLFAPPFAADGEWHELGGIIQPVTHTAKDILKALGRDVLPRP